MFWSTSIKARSQIFPTVNSGTFSERSPFCQLQQGENIAKTLERRERVKVACSLDG